MTYLGLIAFFILSFFLGNVLFIQDQINTDVVVLRMTGSSVSIVDWALKKIQCRTDDSLQKIWVSQNKISDKASAFSEPLFVNTQTHHYAIPFHFYGTWGQAHGFIGLSSDGESLRGVEFSHLSDHSVWQKNLITALNPQHLKEKKIVDAQHQLTYVSFISNETAFEVKDPNQIGIGFVPHFLMNSFEKQFNMSLKKYETYSLSKRAIAYPDVALALIAKKFLPPKEIQVMQNSIFPNANAAYATIKTVSLDVSKSVVDKLKPIEPLNYVEIEPGSSQKLLFFIEESRKYMRLYSHYKFNLNPIPPHPTENPTPPSLMPQEVSNNETI